jgi:hypothetical protein
MLFQYFTIYSVSRLPASGYFIEHKLLIGESQVTRDE